jgi:hypothetical protein
MKRTLIQIINFVIVISFISSSLLFLSLNQLSFAQKDDDEDENDEDNDKLIVKAQINLEI